MGDWSRFSPEEVERRRAASVEAMKAREREEWNARYQEHCDRLYWSVGQCCAGCDHWESDGGEIGRCTAAQIMPGRDVLLSLGWTFSTYIPPPGHPYTKARNACGRFSDAFDWSTLDRAYLVRIGAMESGALKPKPATRATEAQEPRNA